MPDFIEVRCCFYNTEFSKSVKNPSRLEKIFEGVILENVRIPLKTGLSFAQNVTILGLFEILLRIEREDKTRLNTTFI
jgi:hypothetical protein